MPNNASKDPAPYEGNRSEFLGVCIDEELLLEVKALARIEERSVSWLVRAALKQYIQKAKEQETNGIQSEQSGSDRAVGG